MSVHRPGRAPCWSGEKVCHACVKVVSAAERDIVRTAVLSLWHDPPHDLVPLRGVIVSSMGEREGRDVITRPARVVSVAFRHV